MANTVTQRTLVGSDDSPIIVRLINIVSDGSEETDLVVFDNSAFSNKPAKGSLVKVQASGSSCVLRLEWDQTTDSPIVSLDPSKSQIMCFKDFGGIVNPNGTGATGDILLTTSGLDAGDEVTLIITVRQ